MSSYANNNRSIRSDRKFCGVCQKKGLPESVYTSHFTKSVPGDKGIVTCPTILSAICRYCGKSGHWADAKFCSAMRQDQRGNSRTAAVPASRTAAVPASRTADVPVNRFALLDSDEEVVTPVVAAPVATPIKGVSWAAMAKKPAEIAPVKEESFSSDFVVLSRKPIVRAPSTAAEIEEEEKQRLAREIYKARVKGTWAALSDSEDDEDEDEEEFLE